MNSDFFGGYSFKCSHTQGNGEKTEGERESYKGTAYPSEIHRPLGSLSFTQKPLEKVRYSQTLISLVWSQRKSSVLRNSKVSVSKGQAVEIGSSRA